MAATAPLAAPGPEAELLLRCARARPRPEARRRIGELLSGPCDWERLVRLALHHKVTPLLYRALARRPEVPAEVRAALRLHQAQHARHALAVLVELLELLASLEREAIPAIPFKGPALAELAYGSLAARLTGDLDLLVRPEHLGRVTAALEARGYVEQTRYRTGLALDAREDDWYRRAQAEYVYLRPRDGMVVEPHWALAPRPLAVELDMEGIWRRARAFPLAGREVLGLALEDLVLALSIHGSKHEWTELRWICDVAQLAARHPRIDWSAALARAERQGCARMLRLGLALADRVLEEPLPEPARSAVLGDRTALALAAQVAERLFRVGYGAPSVFRVSRFRLRMRERTRDRLACLARTFATPQIAHVRLLRFPPALRPLYAVATPAIDYVALPLRRLLAPRLRRGLRSASRGAALEALSGAETRLESALEAVAGDALAGCEGEARLGEAPGAGARVLLLGGPAPVEPGRRAVLATPTAAGEPEGAAVRCGRAAAKLPFAAGAFDAVSCRFGWLLWEDPVAGLGELRRLLRPGGKVALAAFAPLAANPLLAAVDRVARELVGGAAVPLAAIVGAFGRRGAPGRLLRRAGFRAVEERMLWGALEPAAAREAARGLLAACAGLEPRELPDATREAVGSALAAALPPGAVRVGVRVASGVRA
jgi:SAM-dependent methyltransferase